MKTKVIILSGQSNASGQSYIFVLKEKATEAAFHQYEMGYKNVLINYCVDDSVNSSNGRFVPVTLGQGAGTEKFGPEVGLASYLSKTYPDDTFYIIKDSWSGSGIGQHWQLNDYVYTSMISVVKDAFSELKEMGMDPELSAFCWMQGETDAMTEKYAEHYYELESELMQRIFEELADYKSATQIAFVDAGISDCEAWTYADIVNNAKIKYALEDTGRIYLDTQAAGLTYNQDDVIDYIHYDAMSMIRLGEMFAEAIVKVWES